MVHCMFSVIVTFTDLCLRGLPSIMKLVLYPLYGYTATV